MFRTKRTKILSAVVEEILEVKELIIEDQIIEPEIVYRQIANIEFLTIEGEEGDNSYGMLTDYDGLKYYYEWDLKSKRIIRLAGEELDSLTWQLCNEVLNKYYIKPEAPKAVEPIGPQMEKVVNKALSPVADAFKKLESKVDKVLMARPAPAPVQQIQAPRPQIVQSVPSMSSDTPAINVADNDISANAMRYLQESNTPDLGIDYMSL